MLLIGVQTLEKIQRTRFNFKHGLDTNILKRMIKLSNLKHHFQVNVRYSRRTINVIHLREIEKKISNVILDYSIVQLTKFRITHIKVVIAQEEQKKLLEPILVYHWVQVVMDMDADWRAVMMIPVMLLNTQNLQMFAKNSLELLKEMVKLPLGNK